MKNCPPHFFRIHPSSLIAFLIIFINAGLNLFYRGYNLSFFTILLVASISTVLAILSLILHELIHASIGKARSIPVQNIIVNFLGGFTVFQEETIEAKDEFWITLGGPLSNAILGILLYLPNWLEESTTMSLYFQFMLSYCALINFLYAGFNLLPIYPYDGGRILRSILWMRKKEYNNATIKSIYVGYYTGIVVVALGFYFLIEKFFPFYNFGIIIIGFYFISVSRTYIKQINEFNSTKT